MQHVDGLRELGDLQHSMLEGCVHADFAHPGPDTRHGLPVQGIQALLDASQLQACQSAGIPRKRAHIATRGAEPLQRFIRHGLIYEYWYESSSAN
jgi:hypothetical protein